MFAVAALSAGLPAILKAILIEITITAVVAGFQGMLTEKLRMLEPAWRTTLVCACAVALLNHPAEYLLHTWMRTPRTGAGICFSLAYTLIATRFSLCVMRQGLFLAGVEGVSFAEDLRRLPALLARMAGFRSSATNTTSASPNI